MPEWPGEAGDAERNDLESPAELYSQHREAIEQVTARSGGHTGFIGGALAPNGIVDVIRRQAMEDFLAYATPMQAQWQSEYHRIGADLAAILPTWHTQALLLDREEEHHILLTCLLEKQAVETLLACGQEDFLSSYYAGDDPVPAHLMHYVPTASFVEGFLSQNTGLQKALTQASALMGAQGALSRYQQWRGEVEHQTGLRFRSVEGLSDEARTAIAGEVQIKEKLLGQAVLGTLLDDVQDVDLGQRITTLASRLPDGQRLMFAERLGLLELGWDIPDQSVLGRIQQALDDTDTAMTRLTALERELEQLRRKRQQEMARASRRGTRQAHRRAADQFNARKIREAQADINRHKRLLGEAFDALAETRAAAGSPAQLERWARVANGAMGAVALLGGLSGALEVFKQSRRIDRADTDAERLASQVAFTGAAGVALGGLSIGIMSMVGRTLGKPAVAWRLLLLKFAGPAGWVVAVGTALLIIGEVLANRFSLSPVQRWCQRSHWGREDQGWDREAHERELARLGDTDLTVERQGQAEPHGGPGPGPAGTDLAIRIGLPGLDAPNAENLALGLWGVTPRLKEMTRDFLEHAELETRGSSYALHYHFDPETLAECHEFRLVIRTKGPEASTTRVFQLHRRGTSLSDEWREISALGDRFLTRYQVGNWPDMPLTPWP
ncbi:hypothetical protein ACN2MM_04845 [Alkalilimnicola ehrlichii MLHE-1]|nr:hypothetical protein [Alkalilimnicola ehrlichii]